MYTSFVVKIRGCYNPETQQPGECHHAFVLAKKPLLQHASRFQLRHALPNTHQGCMHAAGGAWQFRLYCNPRTPSEAPAEHISPLGAAQQEAAASTPAQSYTKACIGSQNTDGMLQKY